jgi:tRNA 2-thiocytidine biosynthesis protein TtcA
MPPKLLNEDGDLLVLRPLIHCAEEDLARFAEALAVPIIPCDLCGSQDGLERAAMKRMLGEWEKSNPGRKQILWRALQAVRPSQLADRELMDFAGLKPRSPPAAAPDASGAGTR